MAAQPESFRLVYVSDAVQGEQGTPNTNPYKPRRLFVLMDLLFGIARAQKLLFVCLCRVGCCSCCGFSALKQCLVRPRPRPRPNVSPCPSPMLIPFLRIPIDSQHSVGCVSAASA